MKAGGAIGIFIIVYTQNPPPLQTFETVAKLQGEWFYDVHPTTEILGHGSKHYGGIANFQRESNKFGEGLSITGTLDWKYEGDSLVRPGSSQAWKTISGSITANDKLIYQYQAFDFGKQISGFCSFNIVRDSTNEITQLIGEFFRVDSPYVKGSIYMRRDKPYYERSQNVYNMH